MVADSLITARVTSEMKERFAAVARYQALSESALLKRLVEAALLTVTAVQPQVTEVVEPVPVGGKISVRLRTDDLLLLRERAKAREMPTSTYVSLLIRSHLRSVTPLPTAELAALKRSTAEIGAIGRNLNQIARALNQGERPNGPSKADLYALLRALNGLRVHIKTLINENLASWRNRYEKTNH
ncbi:MAG: plasmid mobilization protein [Beijerinckiaceae bacterium]